VRLVAVTATGQVVSGSRDRSIKIWDLASGRLVRSLEGHTKSVNSVAVTAAGQVVSGSDDNTIKIWDLASGRLVRSLEWHTASVRSVAVTATVQVVSGSYDKTIKLWDLDSGESIDLFENEAPILCMAVSPDGRWLAAGDELGHVWIFEWIK